MTIRPVDLPEIRAELMEWGLKHPGYWDEFKEDKWCAVLGAHGKVLQGIVSAGLSGDLFFASSAMAELACVSGQSLPLCEVDAEDLPSLSGLLLFEEIPDLLGRKVSYSGGEGILAMRGGLWQVHEDGSGVWVLPVIEGSAKPNQLVVSAPWFIPFAGTTDRWEAICLSREKESGRGPLDDLVMTMRSTWLLMQQPLIEDTEVQPDRAARKRLARAGHEPKAVRVIELRRPKSSGESGDGESNYHHQWIVKGHWRQHWYPKREVHRPVWIAPHIKGPEGAPLIGGEKVYALKR